MKKFITIMVLALAAMLMVSCLGMTSTIKDVQFAKMPQPCYKVESEGSMPTIEVSFTVTYTDTSTNPTTINATIDTANKTIDIKDNQQSLLGIEPVVDVVDKADVDNCYILTITFGTYATLKHEFYVVTDINDYYFAGGDGSTEKPYEIENAQQLSNIRYNLEANYILKNDIDISDMQWDPIGNGHRKAYSIAQAFKGTFDGKGYKIIGLTNKNYQPDVAYVGLNSDGEFDFSYGLFGCTDGATIKNLTLTNVNINFDNEFSATIGSTVFSVYPGSIGAVVGQAFNNLTLENVTVGTKNDGSKIIARDSTAGLVGRLYQKNASDITEGKFINCNNYAHIYIEANDDKKIAGFIGFVTYEGNTKPMHLKFESCINYGFIETSVNNTVYQSGFANVQRFGENNADTIIMTNCKNKGEIKGKYHDEKKLVQLMVIEHELGININLLNKNFNKGKVNGFKNGCYIIIENCEIKTGGDGEYPAFAACIEKI